MVSDEEDSHVNVPSYFRCPISLDVMKSPVSLCTGVTYDRSSIQRWFDDGNNTCPATMQVLHNKDLIPNYTLQRLIKIWVDSSLPNRPPTSPPPPLHSINATQLLHQLHTQLRSIRKHASSSSAAAITLNINRLTSFAAESEENAANCGAILPLLMSVVGRVKDDLGLLEKVIVFTNVLVKNSEKNIVVVEDHEIDLKSSILTCMKQGRLELRMAVAKFLNLIISTKLRLGTHSSSISEDEEILSETLKLITTCDWNSETVDDCLSFLTSWSISKRNNRVKVVRGGGVKVVAAALSAADMRAATTEKALKLLELMSACKEGRSEICGSEVCVKAVVKKLLKVSTAATEQAVAVLWNLCCLFGEKRAAGAVVEGNGMGKILMVMQSNCSPAVRQMCGDLLRVLRSRSKTCWYDTKTTHITPF